MKKIECKINGRTYSTTPLYFEDFTTLGFIVEEKFFPLAVCLTACIGNNLSNDTLLNALYTACKDVFNRNDFKFVANLVINREHLLLNGKPLDEAEWQKHWQEVGYIEYRYVVTEFIKANLGNFSNLSMLIPGWTEKIGNGLIKRLLVLLTRLNEASQQCKEMQQNAS